MNSNTQTHGGGPSTSWQWAKHGETAEPPAIPACVRARTQNIQIPFGKIIENNLPLNAVIYK